MPGRILVGTSSWADPGFVKEWYPPKMPAKERLPWYAQRFEMVELNSSFYAVPDRNTVHGWVEVTPEGFTFDVKAHRALSRHSAPVESLPPDLRGLHGTPELELPLAERLVEETAPFRDAGRQLPDHATPRCGDEPLTRVSARPWEEHQGVPHWALGRGALRLAVHR